MKNKFKSNYDKRILERNLIHFFIGLIPRFLKYCSFGTNRTIARLKGAQIGKNVLIPFKLAWKVNSNFHVGNSVSIDTINIDLRVPLYIGDNVIIGENVEIITCSHNIDSKEWEFKPYGITINDYVWIAPKALILPSCRNIGKGAVIGAGSVVVKNIDSMSVVVGNPAYHLKSRKEIHSKIVVESLRGGDFLKYIKLRFGLNQN